MARLISAKGITANGITQIGMPMPGTKWKVKWVVVVLKTGTGSGSRSANLFVSRGNVGNFGPFLAATGTQTGTDTEYNAIGDVAIFTTSNPAYFSSLFTTYYQFPEVFATDSINLAAVLIAGDSVNYYIMVEEEAS